MENQTTATGPATTETNTKVAGVNVHDTQGHRTHAYDALAAAKADIARGKAEAQEAQASTQTESTTAQETGQANTEAGEPSLLSAVVDNDVLNSSHKGVNWNETLSGLPEDAQKLIGNLRADYTKKTQE